MKRHWVRLHLRFFFLFFATYSPSSLNGTQRRLATWSEVSAIWKHIQNLQHPLHLQIGNPKTTFFRQLRILTATLTAYISGKKHEVNNRASALTTTRGLLRRVQKWLQTGPPFLPTLRKYCFLLHYQASRTPANRTELNFAKWWMVNRANNLP